MPAQSSYTREKREWTLVARCALQGITMQRSHDDHGRAVHLLTYGPLTREFGSLDEVEELLDESGAPDQLEKTESTLS